MGNLKFEVDYAKVLKDDEFVSLCEISLLHTGKNRNQSIISKECVENSLNTIFNKPIVAILNCDIKELSTDFLSHAKDDEESKKMFPVGVIPMKEYSEPRFEIDEDGYERLIVNALLWKHYCPTIVDILKNKDGETKVSVELAINEEHVDECGDEIIDSFTFVGVALLGKNIMEGMFNSKLKITKFSYDDMLNISNNYYKEFDIPLEVKDTAKKALEKDTKNKTLKAFAEMLINEKVLTFNQVLALNKKFDSLKVSENHNYLGGAFAKDFCENIIKFKKEVNKMEHGELARKLWDNLSDKMYTQGKETYHKYYIEKIYDGHIIVHDNEKDELFKFKYDIDENGNVKIDFTSEKPLEDDFKKFELFKDFSKDEIGTESALTVDKSKDSISDEAWGSVDKSELRKRIIKAKNFKTIAKDVFLDLREGWEEGKESALKYPVMMLDGDKLIYNRAALGSAKAYAEKNDETEVLNKLKKIYKSLGLEFEAKEEKPKVMMECGNIGYEKQEIINEGCGESSKMEESKKFEEDDKDDDKDEIEEPHAGAQDNKDEKDKKDDEKVRDDETNKEITDMSSDQNVDSGAAQELEEKQAEKNKELINEGEPQLKIIDLENTIAEMEKEMAELRKFKADAEEKEKQFRIGKVFEEIGNNLPKEKKDEFVKESINFSLDNLSLWENMVKASAFEYAKFEPKKESFSRMTIWGNEIKVKKSTSQWDF